MLGLLGALAGAGGAVASGIMGASAQQDAAAYNYYVGMMNYYLRERERRDRINEAERSRTDTKLGATDAQGNRVHFVEGKGWVTDLSKTSQGIQNAQNREQMNVLNEDLPRQRQQARANYTRQLEEGYAADGLLQQFYDVMRGNPSDEQALTYGQAAKGINDAFDRTTQTAMRSNIRSGASNSGQILADMAKARADKLSSAAVNARLTAIDNVDRRYNNNRAQLANLYQMFGSAAKQNPSVPYAPQNTSGASNAIMQSMLSGIQGANNQTIAAYGQKGGEFDYVEPMMGAANAVGQAGMGLMGAFNQAGAANRNNDATQSLLSYITNNSGSRLRASGAQGDW